MKNLGRIASLLVLTTPALVSADAPPKPVMELQSLVGTWKGSGTMKMGKDTANIEASWNCQRTAAQFGVLCTFHVTGIPGVPAIEETDLLGYEPNSNAYHWYSVTNVGETHDHVAKPPTGRAFRFVYTGTQEGKPFKEVIDLEISKDNRLTTGRAETFIDGASASLMQIELRK